MTAVAAPPTPWWEQRFTGFDLETTHPDPTEARIVTAAVAEVGAGQPIDARSWLVDPDIEIPAGATAVHGITTEQAREVGELAGDAIPAIIDRLAERPAGTPIAIFNAPFDLTTLFYEAVRCGIRPLQERGPLIVIDPLVLDKHLDRYRPGLRKLGPTCEWYRVPLDGAHDAVADAVAAARLALRICRDAMVIRKTVLWDDDHQCEMPNEERRQELEALTAEWDRVRADASALHALQVELAREQRMGLADYFRKQGHPDADRVSLHWPIEPMRDVVMLDATLDVEQPELRQRSGMIG